MKALIQRVSRASVQVAQDNVGEIGRGLLVLLAVEKGDSIESCHKLADKVTRYRVFPDELGRMNLSLQDIQGGILVVSQFTLAADTRKGLRPSFTPAAEPEDANNLYQAFAHKVALSVPEVATGQFGANMQVSLCNDGPVTFLLEVSP